VEPEGAAVQIPSEPLRSQRSHTAPQVALQQYPSTHLPFWHSLFTAQVPPSAFRAWHVFAPQ